MTNLKFETLYRYIQYVQSGKKVLNKSRQFDFKAYLKSCRSNHSAIAFKTTVFSFYTYNVRRFTSCSFTTPNHAHFVNWWLT